VVEVVPVAAMNKLPYDAGVLSVVLPPYKKSPVLLPIVDFI
jgi:hypothetical protein